MPAKSVIITFSPIVVTALLFGSYLATLPFGTNEGAANYLPSEASNQVTNSTLVLELVVNAGSTAIQCGQASC
ncbi:MAG: hypothetical protein ACYC7D_00855 [Nitrososphaerales archaeon]